VIMADETPIMAQTGSWLERARQGDAEAFCSLAAGHEERLFRQALALCANSSTAEDLVVETLHQAWRGLGRFDGSCRFSTWLYAILVHRHLKLVRHSRSRPVSLASLPAQEADKRAWGLEQVPDQQPSASDNLAARELADQLRQAIARLPEIHQAVILLRFFEEASLPEIAAALHLPLGTVKSRLHHALARLRQEPALMNLLPTGGNT
jgi:RNA polymerase sigma-70 factor, ECF subfamily